MPRLSSKNQLTIPVDVLRDAGIEPGDDLHVHSPARGRVEILRRRDVIEEVAGSMTGTWPPGALEELRGEWDR